MAAPQTIPAVKDSGLSTINDLYNLINGSSTTSSGSTKTTSSSMDQSGMNEMLKSALASTSGLAAVSQGQRSAGGYGSATNQLLTNDLLTRTASQIAQNNKSETTTVSPTTTTVGGVTGGGVAKTASFLAALQSLDKLGIPDKLKKIMSADSAGGSSADYSNPANQATSSGNPNLFSTSQSNMTSTPVDNFVDLGSYPTADFSEVDTGIDMSTIVSGGAMQEDPLEFLSGMADGGEVSTKKSNVLGTSQFNRILGDASPEITQVDNSAIQPVATQPADAFSGVGANIGNHEFGGEGASVSGGVNLKTIGSALSVLGALSGNKSLSDAGTLGSIFGSSNPLAAAGLTVANIATKGAAGTVLKGVRDPSLSTIGDIALSFSNPAFGIVNTLLGMADMNSLGVAASNAVGSMSVDGPTRVSDAFDPMTQAIQLQQSTNESNPNDPVTDVINSMGGSGSQHSFGSFGDRGPGGSSGAMGDTDGSVGNDGLADGGGMISAPGDGTTDTKLVPLANKEYVLPADVVEMIGKDKLDGLVAKYHTPVAVQKLQKFARG